MQLTYSNFLKNLRITTIFLFFLFLFFPQQAFAVTTTITNYPTSITSEPFTVEVSVSGAGAGTNYLRADLYKEGSSNYFGETFNGSSWYGGSDHTQYPQIAVQSGATASASFQARIGSPTSSEYDGSGNYKLRIRRYTSSGGYTTSEANNSSVAISINVSTPTPTPTPAPTSSSTSTPKPATPKPTPKPTTTPTATSIAVTLGNLQRQITSSGVLSQSTITPKLEVATPSPTPKNDKAIVASENNTPKVIAAAGVLFLIIAGILVFRRFKYGKNNNIE